MAQWLDSLSEDWVSQPRSSHANSINHSATMQEQSSPSNNGSQSRIPRYKPRSASNTSVIGGKDPLRRLSGQSNGSTKDVLREKTPSNMNAGSTSHQRVTSKQIGPKTPHSVSDQKRADNPSTIPQDTVQHRSSPAKDKNPQGTPEWKRRMLNGKTDAEQMDLFSPIGLEGMFKPPTLAPKPKARPTAKKTVPNVDKFPSNPPSVPALAQRPPSPVEVNPIKSRGPHSEKVLEQDENEVIVNGHAANASIGSSGQKAKENRKSDIDDRSLKSYERAETAPKDGQSQTPSSPTIPLRVLNSKADLDKSGVRSDSNFEEHSRVSAGEQTRNEGISPFFVSKHNTVDGRVDYAAIGTSVQRSYSTVDKLWLQQQNLQSSRSSDNGINYAGSRPSNHSMLRDQINEITSQSLPDDLSMGTDAFIANGGFVAVRRGGYSSEGSFQRRTLSPSSSLDLDGPSLKVQLLKKRDSSEKTHNQAHRSTPVRPPTPPKTPNEQDIRTSSFERPRSFGSPLKLFGQYDTFTNDRLATRMSKFEETLRWDLQEDEAGKDDGGWSSPSPEPKVARQWNQPAQSSSRRQGRRISSFGNRELDDHPFPHYPRKTSTEREHVDPDSPQLWKSRSDLFTFERLLPEQYGGKRSTSRKVSSDRARRNERLDKDCIQFSDDENASSRRSLIHQHVEQTVHGKRSSYSPAKDTARKRRRTLCTSTELEEVVFVQHHQVEYNDMPNSSVLGRKRKDALNGSERQAADPEVIAARQILRPRAPTPGQTGSSGWKPKIKWSAPSVGTNVDDIGDLSIQGNNPDTLQRVDPPTQIVAGALATVALNTVQDITYGSRKASVTTADFFSEAQQIMRLIRAEKRPQSTHTTTDTSDINQRTIPEESTIAESTKEELSRPPSREGACLPKLKESIPLDARVVSHLRKFEDEDDLGLALTSSIKTLKISQSRRGSETSAMLHREQNRPHGDAESDPPNTRILQSNGFLRESLIHQGSDGGRHAPGSLGSQESNARSTGRSIPTGSSGSSGNRMVIAPKTVAHLLSDQMAGMFFDRERQVWVRRKGSINTNNCDTDDHTESEGTEEDLFGHIPDLSVDDMEELKRVKDAVSGGNTLGSAADHIYNHDHAVMAALECRVPNNREPNEDVRPKTADENPIEAVNNSSAPSRYSHFTSGDPLPGTRAISWSEDASPPKEPQAEIPAQAPVFAHPIEICADEVEHEISILEGRVSHTPGHQSRKLRQPRVVTVAFSSPLVDNMSSPYLHNEDWEAHGESQLDESPSRYTSQPPSSTRRSAPSIFGRRQSYRGASRRVSIGSQSYIARPMSRVDEQEEMSMVHCSIRDQQTGMDLAISTPLPLSRALAPPPTTTQRSRDRFHLSPLSDFTVNQIDKPIDVDHDIVAPQGNLLFAHEVENRLSLTAQGLVKNLTDLEPYEPYWEHIRSVDLHDRQLASLHMLDEFCGRIEELDVSNNRIRELNGIPESVRLLKIRGNYLSDLTAWHALRNLQYLDVSDNRLESLKGFQGLVHLRTLKANDNDIESLEGLEDLDSLLSLSLRGNRLRAVNFENTDMRRLTDLDMHGNALAQVFHLHCLPALKTCNLSNNDLEDLYFYAPLPSIESLDVVGNQLKTIDVTMNLPKLRILNIDRNFIDRIKGLKSLRALEILSWREQAHLNPNIQYQDCHEVRKLYLSGNTLASFIPNFPFLNLQTLELVSTGLQTLSPDFGVNCPNLRILNLNYNAVRDLRPLLGISKLQKLYVAGNRVLRLRRTAAVLDRLGNEIVEVDLRNNPLTVGFYTPQDSDREEKRMVLQDRARFSDANEEDTELINAKKYLLPALDKEIDNISRERLDEDTKLRRRVYEMLIFNSCRKLERLDGLEVDRLMVGRRDGVWERLLELGVLREKGGKVEVDS